MDDLTVSIPFEGEENPDKNFILKIPTKLEILDAELGVKRETLEEIGDRSMVEFSAYLDSLPKKIARTAIKKCLRETTKGSVYNDLKKSKSI